MNRRAFVLAGIAAAGLAGAAIAQDASQFPSRNIFIVVPNAAGGGLDYFARLVGAKLQDRLGKPVVVENRPGANGNLAAAQVTKAAPDGHTLLLGSIGMLTVNPVVVSNLTYDPQRDFTPIARIAKFPLILTVNAKAPVKTVQELVAYAKANPDKANAAATGPIFQVVQKMFEQRTGATFTYIAFRANSEAMMALMRGDALMSLSDVGPATAPLQDGRVRALAVTSPQRLPSHPDVPTMAEAGFKDMAVEFWTGLLAPAKTPIAIVKKLEAEIQAIVKMPEVVEKLAAHQTYPAGESSEEFARIIARELVQWGEVAKKGNIKIE
ncbi:MAG: tripartite tricarboxylate transporter substrate binding protein [Xanthobacteraceae bacterium]|nr:tripartite tricarboxylate transporter substrate binding protein [Xanthobacteraceae bacterium]